MLAEIFGLTRGRLISRKLIFTSDKPEVVGIKIAISRKRTALRLATL